jgi:DNA-binding response OmpR family regulator
VIALTARTDKETVVKLLRLGADDYVSKPFDTNELLARIDVQLRRSAPQEPETNRLYFKNITLDPDCFDAMADGHKAGLSKREFEILQLMMTNSNKVFTKNNLYESVWGGEFLGDDNTVNVHISKIRAKLNVISSGTEYIQTVWGIGFKMAE